MTMLPFKENKKLVDRPENDPKVNLHSPIDRKIILTLVLAALAVLAIVIVLIFVIEKNF